MNGKPHCVVEQGAHQLQRQGMHSLSGTLCVFGAAEKKLMQGVKVRLPSHSRILQTKRDVCDVQIGLM